MILAPVPLALGRDVGRHDLDGLKHGARITGPKVARTGEGGVAGLLHDRARDVREDELRRDGLTQLELALARADLMRSVVDRLLKARPAEGDPKGGGVVRDGVPDCKLFGKACTPDRPIGACMVSSEGSCAAYYKYQAPSTD